MLKKVTEKEPKSFPTISDRLKALKWTQQELADLAGYTQGMIGLLVNGTARTPLDTAERLAPYLEVDAGDLFLGQLALVMRRWEKKPNRLMPMVAGCFRDICDRLPQAEKEKAADEMHNIIEMLFKNERLRLQKKTQKKQTKKKGARKI